jgi:hypothetical protein
VITLPYRFDTSSVWHTILKGAFALNAVLVLGIVFSVLVSREWTTVLGLALVELVVLGLTRVLIKAQEGSVGTLSPDRVVIEPNLLFGVTLPGPRGTYTLDRFAAVRVEFRGAGQPDVQTGPHELVWLAGKPGTPDVLLERTHDRAGPVIGEQLGALLGLPVRQTGAPREFRL